MTLPALHTLGNTDLLQQHKVAFLCSRKCPAAVVLKSFDWAIEQREKGICVISSFHSRIEKDVLHYLLKGTQSIILVLARGMMKRWPPEIKTALDAGRLLILTRYTDSVTHASEETCFQRNRLMMELGDEIVIGYASPGGNLERLCGEHSDKSISKL
ncbi:DNA-processing protein DprA [Trichlorobacter lovleyi]|uniref:DNA-processing protein DprA n=1 Tax=Trichlorobacter lovleyi TaxID=313985 RepID=UPI0024800E9F|nr:DNA-processing protein DprA [Trichlorobacter lovleyi]